MDTLVTLLSDQSAELDFLTRMQQPIVAYPLSEEMSQEGQRLALQPAPPRTRKVVVSTSIAELDHIEGIIYVVDTGLVKLPVFNRETGCETLLTIPTSESSASQRMSICGKSRPGKCFRLYTGESHSGNPIDAEMLRFDLTSVVLRLKAIGIDNIFQFDYFTPPPADLLEHAIEMLYSLNILDNGGKLTFPFGRCASELNLEPRLSAMVFDND